MNKDHKDKEHFFKTSIFPIVIFLCLFPFMFYLQRSRIDPRGISLESIYESLSYYHSQLSFYILLTTLIVFIPKIRKFSIIIICAFFVIDTFDWLSWHTQKRPFFFEDIYRAIQLIIYYPEFVTQLPTALKLKLAFLLSLPVIIYLFLRIDIIKKITIQYHRSLITLGLSFFVITAISLPFLISSRYPLQNTFFYILYEGRYQAELSNLTINYNDIKERFGHTINGKTKPPSNSGPPNKKKPNIILFVIETAPYPYYPSFQSLIEEVDIPWLSKNSIFFNNHYTTNPVSDRSIYSLLAGKYPPADKGNDWKEDIYYGESLITSIAKNKYRSYFFSTAPFSFYNDFHMYSGLGFDVMKDIEKTKSLMEEIDGENVWKREGLYDMDKILISEVTQALDFHNEEYSDIPFFIGIAPQSSHAPFHCPPDFKQNPKSCADDKEKIKSNAIWQFNLLKQIVNKLSGQKILDNTIVVVTGDHGIRSEQESTLIKDQRLLDDITFHVPFLIATPLLQQINHPVQHPTTHADLAPTLINLIGASYQEGLFHGRDMFEDGERTIYFLGGNYSPVSGFVDSTGYYMENRSSFYHLFSNNLDFSKASEKYATSLKVKQKISKELLHLRAFLQSEYYKDSFQ
ncbi:MAG: sulfatase-like hydrolase/transferase [Candidatus Thiodiazotropha sp.]